MDAKDLNNIQEAYLGIYDEGYVPLRTDDKPYDSEGNPTDTPKWYRAKAKKQSAVGMQKALSSFGVGDSIETLSRGLSAQRRLDAVNREDERPESQRRASGQERERRNRKHGENKRRLETAWNRQHLETSLKKEEIDIYDIILSYLLDEGYASTPEEAEAIMVNMDEEWRNSIYEGHIELDKKRQRRMTDQAMRHMNKGDDASWEKAYKIENERDTQTPEVSKSKAEANRKRGEERRRQQAEQTDFILSYLLDEGYAETPEAAKLIMANMGEEWIQELQEFFFGKMKENEVQRAKEERAKKKKARKPAAPESTSTGKDPWDTHPSDAKMHAKEDR